MAPLRPKHQRFVAEYLKDLNATQAAIRAGYSEKTAGSQAHDLLKKPEISEAIAQRRRDIVEKISLSVDECFENLAKEAKGAETSRDRIAATTALLKYQHKIADKVEHSGSVTIVVADPYAVPRDGDEGAK